MLCVTTSPLRVRGLLYLFIWVVLSEIVHFSVADDRKWQSHAGIALNFLAFSMRFSTSACWSQVAAEIDGEEVERYILPYVFEASARSMAESHCCMIYIHVCIFFLYFHFFISSFICIYLYLSKKQSKKERKRKESARKRQRERHTQRETEKQRKSNNLGFCSKYYLFSMLNLQLRLHLQRDL